MSATATTPAPTRASRAVPSAVRVTFPRLLRSEWIKLWTVRSTWWVVPITVLVHVGFAWLLAFFGTREAEGTGADPGLFTASDLSAGLLFSQLVIAVLAVLTVTGEYSTGMIRSTLTAAPTRLPALWAKALVVVAVAFAVGAVSTLLAWAVTYPVLGEQYGIDLGSEVNQRVLIGTPLYMAAIALLAFSIGALLRHSAAALATVLGLLLVVENVLASIPVRAFEVISPFLPSTAGSRILTADSDPIEQMRAASDVAVLSPWQGYAVLVAWGLVALAAASVLLRRRDA